MMSPSPSFNMGVFGERMRREREMRGVSLEEIALSTKISKRHLEALEQENFDSLPGGIFNRGFVRAYARYLGIDEEQAIADYIAADQQEPLPEEKFPLDVHVRPDPVMNPRRSVMPVLLALLILGCVAAGWTYWFKYRPTHQARVPASSEAPAPPSPALAQPSQTAPPSEPATASDSPQAASGSPAVTEVASPSSVSHDRFTVVIKAREQSWVSIKADGRTVTERVLTAGEEQATTAAKEIMLTVGNAAGVDVKFNGTPQGALGTKGTVRTLTFTPQGPERIGAVPQRGPRLQ